jgi:hypothetical protein
MNLSKLIISLCLFLVAVMTASAASVTYSFSGEVPTLNGPMPGSFVLSEPNFITGTTLTQFMGSDFDSCSAPGTGTCIGQFSIGPSPISGLADKIGFGNDVCCFIYFFPDMSFTTPGTYTADPFHSAGNATLTVRTNEVPEPGTFGLAAIAVSIAALSLRKRCFTPPIVAS